MIVSFVFQSSKTVFLATLGKKSVKIIKTPVTADCKHGSERREMRDYGPVFVYVFYVLLILMVLGLSMMYNCTRIYILYFSHIMVSVLWQICKIMACVYASIFCRDSDFERQIWFFDILLN